VGEITLGWGEKKKKEREREIIQGLIFLVPSTPNEKGFTVYCKCLRILSITAKGKTGTSHVYMLTYKTYH